MASSPVMEGARRSGGTKDRRNRPGEESRETPRRILSYDDTRREGGRPMAAATRYRQAEGTPGASARKQQRNALGSRRGTISSLSFGAATTCHMFHRQQCVRRQARVALVWACLLLAVQPSTQAHRGPDSADTGACVVPVAGTCASTTTAVGTALSLATAGLSSVFTIVAKDSNYSAVVNSPASFYVDWAPVFDSQAPSDTGFSAIAYPQPCPDVLGGCISAVIIEHGGAGCLENGELRASGGGSGSGFSAVFTQTDGSVTSVFIQDAGSGYSSPPSLSLSAGGTGCTGLSLRAVLQSGTGHEVPFVATRSGLYAVAPSLLVQGGLQGSYFNNMMLSGTAAHRQIDAGIAFDWGHGQVTTEARDKVSVRWQGKIRAVDTGLTILSVNSDAGSGVRLWMDEKLVLERRASSNTSHGRRAASTESEAHCSSRPGSNWVWSDESGQDRIIRCESCPGYAASDSNFQTGLEARRQNLSLVFPLDPVIAVLPTYFEADSVLGVALNGVLILTDHVNMPANLGANRKVDSCGGSVNAAGLYAYRREPSCLADDKDAEGHEPLLGFMLDGVPIYASFRPSQVQTLDECGGHIDSHISFYHYHFRTTSPHTPSCLKGCVTERALISLGNLARVLGQPAACLPATRQYSYSSLGQSTWVRGASVADGAQAAHDSTLTASVGVNMTAGQLYALRLEYQHEVGAARVRLSWRGRYRSDKLVPPRQLFHLLPISLGNEVRVLRVEPGPASAAASTAGLLHPRLLYPQSALTSGASGSEAPPVTSVGIVTVEVKVRDIYGNLRLSGADTHLLDASVMPVSGPADVNASLVLADQGHGTYFVKANIKRSGNWSVAVLLDGMHVQASPLLLMVKATTFDAARSSLIGNVANGRQVSMTRGQPAIFSIQAKDRFGNNLTNDETLKFNVLMRQKGILHRVCEVTPDTRTGLHTASCQHANPGVFDLEILSGQEHVANSPLQVQVSAGFTCASQSYAYGHGVSLATAGLSTRFTIQARDALGTAKLSGGDVFESSLNLTTQRVAASITDTSDPTADAAAWCGASVSASGASYSASYLAAATTSAQTSLMLDASFPVNLAAGTYLRIDSEVMVVVGQSGNVLQVTRAQIGTTASAHLFGANVRALYADCGGGTFVGIYTATRSGVYDLHVRLGGLHPIQSTPHRVMVTSGSLCASKSVAMGSGLTLATAGWQARYTVTARDAYDNDVDHLSGKMLDFSVFSNSLGVLASGKVHPSSDVDEKRENRGKYFVQYTALRGSPVRCFHNIQIDGTAILGNLVSFHTVVVPPRIAAKHSTTSLTSSAPVDVGQNLSFSLTARDGYKDVRCLNSIVHVELSGNLSVLPGVADGSGKVVTISCTAPCQGSGLAATYEVSGGLVKYVWLTSGGCGYNAMYPPILSDPLYAPGAIFSPVIHSSWQQWAVNFRGAHVIGGLVATYYDEVDMMAPVASISPSPVDFSDAACAHSVDTNSIVCSAPAASLSDGESFSVRWLGLIQPPAAEVFTFKTLLSGVDERIKLWIDNQLLIDMWSSLKYVVPSGTINLPTAEGLYDIQVQYKEVHSSDRITLEWESSSLSTSVVPSHRLYSSIHSVHGAVTDNHDGTYGVRFLTTRSGAYMAHLDLATQGGLDGEYFANTRWTRDGTQRNRVDAKLDMDWNLDAPMDSFPSDHFTARWTGMIRPPFDDYYTFHIQADDSVTLWFDRAQVFSSEGLAARQEWNVVLNERLSASVLYHLRLDYREHQVAARLRLLWSSATLGKQVVPSSNLFRSEGPLQFSPVPAPSVGGRLGPVVVTVDSSVTASMLAAGSSSHELVVGESIGFDFKTNDAYGNSCPGPDGNHSFLAVRATYRQAVGEISTITVVTGGSNYVDGKLRLVPSVSSGFDASFSTTSGVITSTLIGYTGANFSASTHSVRVEPMFADTTSASCAGVAGCKGMSQDGTVTSIVIGGTATSAYLDGGSASVSCTGLTGCTGMGFSATCTADGIFSVVITGLATSAYTNGGLASANCSGILGCSGSGFSATCTVDSNGAVTSLNITAPGSGYSPSALPVITCAGGSGQTFNATLGVVTGVSITDHGSGYNQSAVPDVLCPNGTGQTFQAKVAGGGHIVALRTKAEEKRYCTASESCGAPHNRGGGLVPSTAQPAWGTLAANHSRFTGQMTMTRAGLVDVATRLVSMGGLSATYYICLDSLPCDPENASIARAAKNVAAELIDFSSAEAGVGVGVTWPSRQGLSADSLELRDAAPFYVRWSGWMMMPDNSTSSDFKVRLQEADERVKVWIDNQLVVDAWHSLASTLLTWSQPILSFVPHTIKLEYKDWSGGQGLTLLGSSNEPLTRQQLYHETPIEPAVQDSLVNFTPAGLCASQTMVWGAGLTAATVSQANVFRMMARDAFGNPRRQEHDWVLGLGRSPRELALPASASPLALSSLGPGSYQLEYTISGSGTYYTHIQHASAGGLRATYYDANNFTQPIQTRLDARMTFETTSLSSDTTFSVRWMGWIKPTLSESYTFRTEPLSNVQGVKLWIDDSLIINEWNGLGATTANASVHLSSANLHALKLEYRETQGPRKFGLVWQTASLNWPMWRIPSSLLYSAQHVAASPFTLTSQPGIPGSGTWCTGHGISIATAGVLASFTIHVRDDASNDLVAPYHYDHITPVWFATARLPTSAAPVFSVRPSLVSGQLEAAYQVTMCMYGMCVSVWCADRCGAHGR